jgi:LysR family transcriptional regulator of gallate degradation
MQEIGIRQARVFLAVADCQSVTRAARVLSRSQTSVTKSLHDLERQIGEKLFDRTSKGVRLTAFGECLLKRAQEAAEAFAAAGQLVPPASLQRSTGTARFFRRRDCSPRCRSTWAAPNGRSA